ncbi:MAG: putative baseplate assembly protein [Anaerolineaceae bacterium]|nr:putative baseplate assembly protein [Anaerolineaceae bacterium]
MTLPAPNLDDLRFQSDLVDEARRRIVQYCPEWTEYNLSDPGITLIELFAWMTEMMVYRLNRVPEKNYIKFLEMLGLQRKPASSARTELTFWLSAMLPLNPGNEQTVVIPSGLEVSSEMTDEEVIFTTDEALEIVPPLLTQVRKEGEFNRNFFPRLGLETFYPFDQRNPKEGDMFYLGFDPKNDLKGHILRLDFTCDPTEAVGIRREDPPWVWECLTKEGEWVEVEPSKADGETDTTGGMNNESGKLVLYLPMNLAPGILYGLNATWLRCRIEQRNALQGMYSESPRLKLIDPFSLGAAVSAMHSVVVEDEELGTSNGEPGQSFDLQYSPILTLQQGETLEVEEIRNGEETFVPWEAVEDFAKSTRYDRQYLLDMTTGTVHFGPSVRQSDGTVVQYGRIPENGRNIRFARYRYGGGVGGNLPEGSINTISMALAFVSRASNRIRAIGGRDQETMSELMLRAQRELQAQRRAVTAQDYEQFTLNSSRSVARTKCLTPNEAGEGKAGTVSVLIVPSVSDSLQADDLAALNLLESHQNEIRDYLDKYRLLTTSLVVREPVYVGVKVKAKIVPEDYFQPAEVQQRVIQELKRYLSPLPLDDKKPLLQAGEKWEGWVFGKDLFSAEIISLIQQVPLVKYVLDVEVSSRSVIPLEEKRLFDDDPVPELTVLDKVLQVPDDGLICSLNHEIEIISIEDMYKKDA